MNKRKFVRLIKKRDRIKDEIAILEHLLGDFNSYFIKDGEIKFVRDFKVVGLDEFRNSQNSDLTPSSKEQIKLFIVHLEKLKHELWEVSKEKELELFGKELYSHSSI